MAEIYTYDIQLKASFTLGEGRYGSNLVSDENDPLAAASYDRNGEEARGLIEVLQNRGTDFDEAVALRMSKKEREAVLKVLRLL